MVCLHFGFGLQVVCLLKTNTPPARLGGGVFALLQTHHHQTKTPTGQTHHQQVGQVVCLHRHCFENPLVLVQKAQGKKIQMEDHVS